MVRVGPPGHHAQDAHHSHTPSRQRPPSHRHRAWRTADARQGSVKGEEDRPHRSRHVSWDGAAPQVCAVACPASTLPSTVPSALQTVPIFPYCIQERVTPAQW